LSSTPYQSPLVTISTSSPQSVVTGATERVAYNIVGAVAGVLAVVLL
jgi:hypothetical protein